MMARMRAPNLTQLSMTPTAECLVASRELESLLIRYAAPPVRDDWFASDFSGLWRDLSEGGWLELGNEIGADNVTGTDLRDLLEIGMLWGRYLVPLPFIETMLLRRWSPSISLKTEVRPAPVTYEIVGGGLDAVIPHGGRFEVVAQVDRVAGATILQAGSIRPDVPADMFAPSLPVQVVAVASSNDSGHLGFSTEFTESIALLAAEAAGAAQELLQRTIRYAVDRVAFGRPVGQFQAVKHLLANMHRDAELALSGSVWAGTGSNPLAAAVAATRAARRVGSTSVQVHGGIGFTWELGLHYYIRHILAIDSLLSRLGTDLVPGNLNRVSH
jgi:Acyl-CoA dehydrogenase, C-terminal domain